jgi:hypothetical protein
MAGRAERTAREHARATPASLADRVDSFAWARLAAQVASEIGSEEPRATSSVPPAAGPAAGSRSSEGPSPPEGGRLESLVSETLRRLLEAGLGRLADQPEQLKQRLAEMKIPREAWAAILSQLDDKKSGLYRLLAKEIRDFLENTNFAADLAKALTTLSFEIKTEVRFVPSDAGAKPKVSSSVRVKQHE